MLRSFLYAEPTRHQTPNFRDTFTHINRLCGKFTGTAQCNPQTRTPPPSPPFFNNHNYFSLRNPPRLPHQPITLHTPLIRQLLTRLNPHNREPNLHTPVYPLNLIRKIHPLRQQAQLLQRARLVPRNVLVAQAVAA